MQTYVYSDKMAVQKVNVKVKSSCGLKCEKKTILFKEKGKILLIFCCIKYMNQYPYGSSSDVPRKRP